MKILFFPLLFSLNSFASVPDDFLGNYKYTEVVGQSVTIDHVIEVVRDDDGYRGIVKSEGVQKDDEIVCRITKVRDDLVLQFQSYQNGETLNQYGIRVYKVGQEILRIKKEAEDKAVIEWKAFHPVKEKHSLAQVKP